ncbi:hypothetical protein I4U23_003043 [Adineta vaga]|nr:hypothetical protein I4U23_003043 [Adineta vaga]
MGLNSSVGINVNFDRQNALYYAGEKITGLISFQNNYKRLKLKSISLQFIGEFDYIQPDLYQEYDGLDHSYAEYRSINNRKSFITIRYPILYPKENENLVVLHQGQYSWPFEFTLPQLLPPSSSPTTVLHPCIRYYTRIIVDKSWYQQNITRVYPLIIFPHVNIFHCDIRRQSTCQCHINRQNFQMKVSLQQRAILPGQTVCLDVDLNNPKRLQIERIDTKLIQHRVINTDHHKEILLHIDLPGLLNFDQRQLQQTFHFDIPFDYLSPTFDCKIKGRHSSISISIYYELKFKAIVHGISDDIDFSMPIIIGTESSSELHDHYDDIPISYIDALKETELPPDYQSVMTNLLLE